MRILLVTHYFPPEIGAPQARLSDLARLWARSGETVTVLTGVPNHPTGIVPPEYRGLIRREEVIGGYRVVRTWLYATPNEGFVKKTFGHLSFMFSSVLLGWRKVGPADVVLVSSPTFLSNFSALFLARLKRARFVVEIRDLWPAIFVDLGVLTNRTVIRLLERIELWLYRKADAVVVVSEGFRRNLIGRGVAPGKVTLIYNGVDLEGFLTGTKADPHARGRLGADPDDTLVLYIGAHGISHGLVSVAETAAILQEEPIHFAFVGEGAAKSELESRVRELGLTNVTLLPGVPRSEVPTLIEAADICLVPLRDVPLFETFIPSKMFELLACGKAVIGSMRGEPAEILGEAGGRVVEPENPTHLAEAIRELSADPETRTAMGKRGRVFVEEHFNRAHLADRYRVLLRDLR